MGACHRFHHLVAVRGQTAGPPKKLSCLRETPISLSPSGALLLPSNSLSLLAIPSIHEARQAAAAPAALAALGYLGPSAPSGRQSASHPAAAAQINPGRALAGPPQSPSQTPSLPPPPLQILPQPRRHLRRQAGAPRLPRSLPLRPRLPLPLLGSSPLHQLEPRCAALLPLLPILLTARRPIPTRREERRKWQ